MFSSHSEYRQRRGGHNHTEDRERLPDNFVRCGYDADTQQYSFRDTATGRVWEGTPGAYYGRMTRISTAAAGNPAVGVNREPSAAARNSHRIGEGVWDEDEDLAASSGQGKKIVGRLWDRVDELKSRDDGGRRGYSAAMLRRLSTIRPGKIINLLRSNSTSFGIGSWENTSSVDIVEGKEVRLAMIAAGEKRTIFDVM